MFTEATPLPIHPNPDKAMLRKLAKRFRAQVDSASVSQQIQQQLIQHPAYRQARIILAFYPLPQEIDLRPLFQQSEKQWYLPRIHGPNIGFHRYQPNETLEAHRFGVMEPLAESPLLNLEDTIDLIILPGLMFDHNGHRLGYGQSFYDRFLSARGLVKPDETPSKIGVVPECLRIPTLPYDPWDHPMDWVLTEAATYPAR